MGDSRDIQHGVYDPVGGVDMKHRFRETQTPHERAQTAADTTTFLATCFAIVLIFIVGERLVIVPLERRFARR